ncbi:MAG: hypothetical protein Q9181_004199 [Wetmoreana brouardii]
MASNTTIPLPGGSGVVYSLTPAPLTPAPTPLTLTLSTGSTIITPPAGSGFAGLAIKTVYGISSTTGIGTGTSTGTGSPANTPKIVTEVTSPSIPKTESASTPRSTPDTSSKTSASSNRPQHTTANSSANMTRPRFDSDSDSVSPGAAAGIGIGCAVAGALIAAALIALFLRRKRRHRPTRSDIIPLNGFGSAEKSVASPDPSSLGGLVERHLPQPAEDQALGGEMSRLRTSIKNHVNSYYHTNSFRGGVNKVALGLVAAGNMPLIASTLESLLSDPATRLVAIRFCIAWTVFSRIDQSCDPSTSFLPPEIASCLSSIGSTREESESPYTLCSLSFEVHCADLDLARMALASRWRSLTAALLQPKYGPNTLTSSDSRNANISAALQALNTMISSFANEPHNDGERVRKLEEILRRGARLGFMLFSQPSLWDFDWNPPPKVGREGLVVSPALIQVGDDNGRKLPRPRVLEEQELAQGLKSYL